VSLWKTILQFWDFGTWGLMQRSIGDIYSWNFSYICYNSYYALARGSEETLSLLGGKWRFPRRKVRLCSEESPGGRKGTKKGGYETTQWIDKNYLRIWLRLPQMLVDEGHLYREKWPAFDGCKVAQDRIIIEQTSQFLPGSVWLKMWKIHWGEFAFSDRICFNAHLMVLIS